MSPGSSSDQPFPGGRLAGGGDGGGFFRGDDRDALAAIRGLMGDEAFERMRRSGELSRRPRPLTDAECGTLRETVAPLLRDLAASGMPLPDIREEAHEDRGDEAVCAWIQGPGITGEGIWVWLESSPAEQVAGLAEQLQDWVADLLHDASRSPGWPLCPGHPALHRLSPGVQEGFAVWACPQSGQVIWPIGALAIPGSPARRVKKRPRRA
jgi:hypothetical protein